MNIALVIGLILVLGVIILIAGLIHSGRTQSEKFATDSSNLPPLNYYTRPDSDILSFWYDPYVAGTAGPDAHEVIQTTWTPERGPGNATDISEVYGPDNYTRNYGPDQYFSPSAAQAL